MMHDRARPVLPDGLRWEHPPARGFWPSLTCSEQRALLASAVSVSFEQGAVLCREGEIADTVMVIESGWTKVGVEATGRAGRELIIALRGAGDIVGERAVSSLPSRSATVTALEAMRALVLPAGLFIAFLKEHPHAVRVLEQQVHERLNEDGGYGPEPVGVEHRLAFLLLELACRRGMQNDDGSVSITLPVSRRELADWAGARPDSMRRILASWREQGVIETARRRITLPDVTPLRRICGYPPGSSTGGDHPWVSARPSRVSKWPAARPGLTSSVLFADVAGFGDPRRDDFDHQEIRRLVYEFLTEAFEKSQVAWADCHVEDRGDGALVIAPPQVPTAAVIDPMLAHLAARLKRHNRQASDAMRIQLRVALHVGPVTHDPAGVSGGAIIHTARLLEADVLKEALATTGSDLGFITSTFVYDAVVRHAPGLVDPATYRKVEFEGKESRITGWMHLSGGPAALVQNPSGLSGPDGGAPGPERAPTAPGSAGQQGDGPAMATPRSGPVFNGEVHVQGDFILGNRIDYRS